MRMLVHRPKQYCVVQALLIDIVAAGVTSVAGIGSATGSATATMGGTELGLGVPITTLTTTNEGITPSFRPSTYLRR